MVTVSETAAIKLNSLIEESGFKTPFVRVSVKGGGCSGLSYELGFEKYSLPSDKTIELSGIKVFIDPKSALYLKGLTLDYIGGLNGQGFTFSNPNATKSCGCGSSFGTE